MALKTYGTHDPNFPPDNERVILHDHAGTGFPSWEVLGNGGAAAGVVSFDGRGLRLVSPDVSANTPGGQSAGASALSRHVRPDLSDTPRIYIQVDWRFRIYRSASAVYTYSKGIEFGVDTADFGDALVGGTGPGALAPTTGNRCLAMVRSSIYDESAAAYYGGKWQINGGEAGTPTWFDLKDSNGNLISPTTPGYERLAIGANYQKWLRQRTELVFDLTPVTLPGSTTALSVTSGSKSATYTGADPIVGQPVRGTSVPIDTFITAVNTGTKTATLSVNATATTSTTAGAQCKPAVITARLEGLRHNGIGFGSLAVGPRGYSRSHPRASELLDQQGLVNANRQTVPALSQDIGFLGGMNAYAQVDNRSNQNSKGTLLLERYRMGAF